MKLRSVLWMCSHRTHQRQHPQTVKFRPARVLSTPATCLLDFRQRIMESCWNAIFASQSTEGASTVAKHGEQRNQLRLDTCIPNTGERGRGRGGGPPIRKELRRALWCGNAEVRNSQALSRLADQDLSDLGSTRVWVNIIILFMEPYELISETNIDST